MKILITGANGYMGRHVVAEAIRNGHEVSAIDKGYDGLPDTVKRVDVDIFSGQEDMYELVGRPDVLIHLAWRDGFIHNSPEHMANLSAHTVFLRNYAASGGKRVAVMGSMHEVGYWEGAITEETPCNPLSQYGIAKNALRQSLLLSAKELDFSLYWLRAYYIFGDDKRGSSVFAKITQAVEEGKTSFPFTTGKNKYDFISLDDLAYQIIAATTQEKVTGVINVCTGEPVSLADQVEQFIKDHHYNIQLEYGAFPDRPYDSPAIWGDNSKIKDILADA